MKKFHDLMEQINSSKVSNVVRKVSSVLSPDLLKPEYREKNKTNPMYGHCYAASEATYHLLGGKKSGLTPHRGKDENGVVHWWLHHSKTGHRIDPTKAQYTSVGKTPPYDVGSGGGFLTKEPSARAREIMDRVKKS